MLPDIRCSFWVFHLRLGLLRSDKILLSYINIRYFPCLIQADSDLVSCVTRLCVAVTFSSTLKRNVVIFEGTLESRLETTKVSRD